MSKEKTPLAKIGYALLAAFLGYLAAGIVYLALPEVYFRLLVPAAPEFFLAFDFHGLIQAATLVVWVSVGLYLYHRFTGTSAKESAKESQPVIGADGKIAADWLEDVMRQIETIYRTDKGPVASLADGRALACLDGQYRVLDTLSGYRRVVEDDSQWPELADAAAKARFLAEACAGLAAAAARGAAASGS